MPSQKIKCGKIGCKNWAKGNANYCRWHISPSEVLQLRDDEAGKLKEEGQRLEAEWRKQDYNDEIAMAEVQQGREGPADERQRQEAQRKISELQAESKTRP